MTGAGGSLISASVGEVFCVECSVPRATTLELSLMFGALALLSILLMRHSCPDIADIHTGLSFPQSWDHSVSAASRVEQTTLTLCLLCPTSYLLTQS